jgi:8-oxoguanine deaminase
MRLWIKDPLAIFAESAERGLIVEGTRIVELIGKGGAPNTPVDETFDASCCPASSTRIIISIRP